MQRLRGLRPAGPPPRPSVEPVRVQRRVSATGTVMVCRQVVSLGRTYAGQTVTVHVAESTLTVELDGQVRVIQRTTAIPVRHVKANKPHKISDVVQAHRQASAGTRTSNISDPGFTLRTYTHLMPNSEGLTRKAVDSMNKASESAPDGPETAQGE